MGQGDGPVMITESSHGTSQSLHPRKRAARTSVLLLQQLHKLESKQNLGKNQNIILYSHGC